MREWLTAAGRRVDHDELGDAERSETGDETQHDHQCQLDGLYLGFGDAVRVGSAEVRRREDRRLMVAALRSGRRRSVGRRSYRRHRRAPEILQIRVTFELEIVPALPDYPPTPPQVEETTIKSCWVWPLRW